MRWYSADPRYYLGKEGWERVREALRPFADAFQLNSQDGSCLTETDVRAMHEAVDIQDFRRALAALSILEGGAPDKFTQAGPDFDYPVPENQIRKDRS